MAIKILGISGSPILDGNVDHFLKEALSAAGQKDGVTTEMISLADRDIKDCKHCNWCLKKQEEGKYCAIADDMQEIYPKILDADGLLLASPSYVGRLSGYLAKLIDRMRIFREGNFYRGKLKDKVGGSLAVSWIRHGGIETTLLSIDYAFFLMDMLPASVPSRGVLYGAGGVSSLGGSGKIDPPDKLLILRDEWGIKGAKALGARVAELAEIIKAGKKALRLG